MSREGIDPRMTAAGPRIIFGYGCSDFHHRDLSEVLAMVAIYDNELFSSPSRLRTWDWDGPEKDFVWALDPPGYGCFYIHHRDLSEVLAVAAIYDYQLFCRLQTRWGHCSRTLDPPGYGCSDIHHRDRSKVLAGVTIYNQGGLRRVYGIWHSQK